MTSTVSRDQRIRLQEHDDGDDDDLVWVVLRTYAYHEDRSCEGMNHDRDYEQVQRSIAQYRWKYPCRWCVLDGDPDSGDELSLDARDRDQFLPDPPRLEDATEADTQSDAYPDLDISPVYWTPEGKRLHASRDCPRIADADRRQTAGSTQFAPTGLSQCAFCIDGGESA